MCIYNYIRLCMSTMPHVLRWPVSFKTTVAPATFIHYTFRGWATVNLTVLRDVYRNIESGMGGHQIGALDRCKVDIGALSVDGVTWHSDAVGRSKTTE